MKKYPYIPKGDGLALRQTDIPKQLEVIAGRFIGNNPPVPYTARVTSLQGFKQDENGFYEINLEQKLGKGSDGYALVCGTLRSEVSRAVELAIHCFAPVRLYADGQEIYRSNFNDEFHTAGITKVPVTLPAGSTLLTLVCRRTVAGFGCRIALPGTTVISPAPAQAGMAGWVWSGLLDSCTGEQAESTIERLIAGEDAGLSWYPALALTQPQLTAQMELFPAGEASSVAWSHIQTSHSAPAVVKLDCKSDTQVYLQGEKLADMKAGKHELAIAAGVCANLFVKTSAVGKEYGAVVAVQNAQLAMPFACSGTGDVWCYTQCGQESFPYGADAIALLNQYTWRVRGQDLYIRRLYEGAFSDKDWVSVGGTAFGRWDYPVGVTLQGLLRAGAVGIDIARAYAAKHIEACVNGYGEAKRDAALYGAPGFNACLLRKEMLDDVGAMCSAMLELDKIAPAPQHKAIADECREVALHKLGYLENGAFYRTQTGTLWADDLYMGTSMLGRYYKLYGDEECLDLAARQFLAFKELLYLPQHSIFAHVYDVVRGIATGIPWGRGNGWVLYSLAELLETMPKDHPRYEALRALFRDFSAGVLALQDDKGYWHQVLTDAASYEETSCTAMFTYAFSKGVINGWYEQPDDYEQAAARGWLAISTYSVDTMGNVHAVCKGSGYSFTKEYYSEDLYWVSNDCHGVGIVLLAGSEFHRLRSGAKG